MIESLEIEKRPIIEEEKHKSTMFQAFLNLFKGLNKILFIFKIINNYQKN